ncbi:hypothetical protein WJX84_000479 [Apatococcus fuscideae]|uniref:Uncharacterized protein n=1 Tax=Apatococcus fuscideae TaxID=2026836 RepID=A0AAW1TDJ7_9CHLO
MPVSQSTRSGHQNAYRRGVLSESPYLTSNQLAYPAKDRYGVKLNRVDLDKTYNCVPREELLCHHEADGSSVKTFLPLNPLTYGNKQIGEPAVQQYLWQARKKHDFKVPVKQISAGPDLDTYVSAAGLPTGKLMPKQPLGPDQAAADIARESLPYYPRPGGQFTASLNKVHRKTGLRQ